MSREGHGREVGCKSSLQECVQWNKMCDMDISKYICVLCVDWFAFKTKWTSVDGLHNLDNNYASDHI